MLTMMKFLIAVLCCLALVASEDPFLEGANLCEFVECPVGTICGETGKCVPFPSELERECPPVMCNLACEFGFKVKNGCPICSCEAPFPSELEQECPPVTCNMACEFGFKVENGCSICACKDFQENCLFVDCPTGKICDPFSGLCAAECPRIMCMLACENGFEIENGCPICACKRDSIELLGEESEEV